MQGHLEKVHAKSHAFTPSSAKRYFFLTPQPSATLLYFRSEADCRVGKVRSLTRPAAHTRLTHTAAASRRRSHTHAVCSHKVRGFVNIGADCRVETDVSGSRSFVVHTPERQLRLIAESPSEAQRWVTVRAASIHTPLRRTGPHLLPNRSGHQRRRSWQRPTRSAASTAAARAARYLAANGGGSRRGGGEASGHRSHCGAAAAAAVAAAKAPGEGGAASVGAHPPCGIQVARGSHRRAEGGALRPRAPRRAPCR